MSTGTFTSYKYKPNITTTFQFKLPTNTMN